MAWMILSTNIYASQKAITVYSFIYPPYTYYNEDGKLAGLSYEVVRQVFIAAGYKPDFKIAPYKRNIKRLFENENAVLMGVLEGVPNYQSIDISQLSYNDFPTSYFYNHSLNPDYGKIKSIEETKGKTVSILSGTKFYEDVITKSGGKTFLVSRAAQVLKAIAIGRTDFAHVGTLTALDEINSDKTLGDLRPLPFETSKIAGGILFRKGSYEAKGLFLEKLMEFHKDGRLLKIFKDSIKHLKGANPKDYFPDAITTRMNQAKP